VPGLRLIYREVPHHDDILRVNLVLRLMVKRWHLTRLILDLLTYILLPSSSDFCILAFYITELEKY